MNKEIDNKKAAELLRNQVSAVIITQWEHRKAKFRPGDIVRVRSASSLESGVVQGRVGNIGQVVAATATRAGKMRSNEPGPGSEFNGFHIPTRMYTKYYVLFDDDRIIGFHSHYLELAQRSDIIDDLDDFDI